MDHYDLQKTAVAVATASVIYILCRRYNRPSIKDIPGPPNPSWVYGHEWGWHQQDVGVTEKYLLANHGTVARWNGPFGEERLWLADPKAIGHVLKNSQTIYSKLNKELTALIVDRGVSWAEGDAHKRQRRAMTPAFGLVEAKGLLPYFAQYATKLVDKWHEVIEGSASGGSSVIDIPSWLSKATLDAIGMGAFEYEFGALDGLDNPLAKTYSNLLQGVFKSSASTGAFLFRNAATRLPNGLLTWFFERDQSPGQVQLRQNRYEAHRVARALIDAKREELKVGTPGKDLMSLMVKTGSALRPEWRLTDDEIIAQVRTIMLAGHDTTAKTLTFALLELAKNRDVQDNLRAEIREAWGKVQARGDSEFAADDFDNMPYLVAVGKETLRVHSPLIEFPRIARSDDVIPLSKPVVGISGKVYNSLPIPKGTLITISVHGYNSNTAVWGADSSEWRPERWLERNGDPESPVGVYGNLATFSGGVRSCIGWRFAVIEMHMFLVTLVRKFDFALPDDPPKIRRRGPGMLFTVVEGEEHKGAQLPLKITPLEDE